MAGRSLSAHLPPSTPSAGVTMFFDDRLATVLRHRATGERAARTQYRQLLDLLGSARAVAGEDGGDPSLTTAAYLRLAALSDLIPSGERARIITEGGNRIRNPRLVEWFAQAEPDNARLPFLTAQLPLKRTLCSCFQLQ